MNLDLFMRSLSPLLARLCSCLSTNMNAMALWARLLKFPVLFVAGVAILHKLQPMFGVVLF